MAIESWLIPVATAVSGVLLSAVAWRKSKPEIRRMDNAAATELVATAGGLAGGFAEYVDSLEERVKGIERRERRRDRMLRTHHDWDVRLVVDARNAGIQVPDPPPLWDDSDDE